MGFVLIAEDDPAIALLLQETIGERLSVETQVVPNGALVPEAIAARRPDLLVLDLALPGLSGLDVFDLVRNDRVWAGIPVLFLTANPDNAKRAVASPGIHRVMGKPFEVDALCATVAALLLAGSPAAV